MKLVEMKINEYMPTLGSSEPAPGGGSASALCGAQGAALVAMAAALTLGRKKYADFQELCAKAAESASALREKLEEQIDLDTEAYNGVTAAYKLPKESDDEKAARAAAIAEAMLKAAQVPMRTMELALEGLELATQIAGKCNVNASSDLGVAALNLTCCVNGSWLNVLTNLSGLEAGQAEQLRARGEDVLQKSALLGEQVLTQIKQTI